MHGTFGFLLAETLVTVAAIHLERVHWTWQRTFMDQVVLWPERRPESVRPQAGRRSSLRSPRRESGKIFWGSCRLLFQPGRLLGCSHPARIHSRTQKNLDLAAAKWWGAPVIGSGRRRPCTRCGNPVLRLGRTGQSGSQRPVFVSLTSA